ncbi:MAG: DUF4956 domain-containing protein [Firmicutes bacterium]|nr:DUF4956 domain-containing protein [Bacillota bacterium]
MSNIFASIIGSSFSLGTFLVCLACAFVCGLLACFAASFRTNATKSYRTSLLLIPMIVTTVILMVNGSIGTGIAVAGTFSLVKFRSIPGDAKQIVSIFLAVASGLACACGYVALAILFTIIVAGVMCLTAVVPMENDKKLGLQILTPESTNYMVEFNDLFDKYTRKHGLSKVKTTQMGSLYKLYYTVEMKDGSKLREFMDELRCRNGNLEVMIYSLAEAGSEL